MVVDNFTNILIRIFVLAPKKFIIFLVIFFFNFSITSVNLQIHLRHLKIFHMFWSSFKNKIKYCDWSFSWKYLYQIIF